MNNKSFLLFFSFFLSFNYLFGQRVHESDYRDIEDGPFSLADLIFKVFVIAAIIWLINQIYEFVKKK